MSDQRTPCSRHDYEDTSGFHPCWDESHYDMTQEEWDEYYREQYNDSKGG